MKKNFIRFYEQYRLFVFPGVVALSSLLLITLIIFPQASTYLSNKKSEGELLNKSKFLETKVSALESYSSEDLSRKLDVALAAYPTGKDFEVSTGLLQQLVTQYGFTLLSATLGNSAKGKDGPEKYELKLEMVGSKSALPTLLTTLESTPRLIRVNNIEVASNNALQALNVSLVVEVLYASAPQSFGSVDSPLPDFSQKEEELIAKLATESYVGFQVDSGSEVSTPRGKSDPFQ